MTIYRVIENPDSAKEFYAYSVCILCLHIDNHYVRPVFKKNIEKVLRHLEKKLFFIVKVICVKILLC